MKKSIYSFVFALLLFYSSHSRAGFYIEANTGASIVDYGLYKDSTIYYGFLAGYSFDNALALELGYIDYDTISSTHSRYDNYYGYEFYHEQWKDDINLTTAAVKLSARIDDRLSLFSRLGAAKYDLKGSTKYLTTVDDFSIPGMNPSETLYRSISDIGFYYGAGIDYKLSKNFSLTTKYEGFNADNLRVYGINTGIILRI